MKLKPLLKDIKDFILFLLVEPYTQVGHEIKEIWEVLTKKRTWVWLWFWIAIILVVFRVLKWALFAILMCFTFLIIYQWNVGAWKHKQRKKWRKKNLPKKED